MDGDGAKDDEDDQEAEEQDFEQAVEIPIDGVLDLHTFDPAEVKELVPDYLEACLERGVLEVRIIHGKGTGTLRRIVHAALERLPFVDSYALSTDGSSWGATIVRLRGPR
jgi:dsDNA-specific endonuclease/ATPase MutS2